MNLSPHPDFPSPTGTSLTVGLSRPSASEILLDYQLSCRDGEISVPAPAPPRRTDELWRTTCFELFLADPDSAVYCEFNFSPSGKWAAYAFDEYRAGMRTLDVVSPPIVKRSDADGLNLSVHLDLPKFPKCWENSLVALTAIVEASDGSKSYWSLSHPSGPPDFHHRDCFVLQLGAAAGA